MSINENITKAWFTGHSYSDAAQPILVHVSLQNITNTHITYTVHKTLSGQTMIGSCGIYSFILAK